MTRADAYARLVEHCDALIDTFVHAIVKKRFRAKTRRLIRALLAERADSAGFHAHDLTHEMRRLAVFSPNRMEAEVKAAVLRRPQTRRGK